MKWSPGGINMQSINLAVATIMSKMLYNRIFKIKLSLLRFSFFMKKKEKLGRAER